MSEIKFPMFQRNRRVSLCVYKQLYNTIQVRRLRNYENMAENEMRKFLPGYDDDLRT